MWKFPLTNYKFNLPQSPHPGAFSSPRRFDIHTGIDLYCHPGQEVFAVEAGLVVAIWPFTGAPAGSPWWHPTQAVGIQGPSGIVVYGEINPLVKVGQKVLGGELIGQVLTVLKKDKGRPMTMLHLELYNKLIEPVIWDLAKTQPVGLLDPTELLQKSLQNQ